MTFPLSFENAESYLEECTIFFKEFEYILCHQNNEILIKGALDHIDVSNLDDIDVFEKKIDIISLIQDDDHLEKFFCTWEKLQVHHADVEERDLDDDLEAPLSPKKKYEILNLVKEVVNICENNNCELLVDFGSGLGYIDQLIYDIADYKVLGLECNANHYDGAQKRQKEYFKDSTSNVKYLKHTVTEDSHLIIGEYLQQVFPNHGPFCLIGLHACADLTVEAIFTFLKMADAKTLAVLPCCYHKMSRDGAKFKYFPLSDAVKKIFEKYEAYSFAGTVTFLRLAAQANNEHRDLYEKSFSLLVRAVLEFYAHKNGFTLKRNKRKPVKQKGLKKDFEMYIRDAANTGYSLIPKPDAEQTLQNKNDEIINGFNMEELRRLWLDIIQGPLFKKGAIYVIMQEYLQPLVENFVLLDRLQFLKERGKNGVTQLSTQPKRKNHRAELQSLSTNIDLERGNLIFNTPPKLQRSPINIKNDLLTLQ